MKTPTTYTIKPDGTVTTDKLFLTVDEVAQALGMSAKGLRNKIAPASIIKLDPRLKPIRIGGSIRFRVDDILKLTAEGVKPPIDEGGDDGSDGAVSNLQTAAEARQ